MKKIFLIMLFMVVLFSAANFDLSAAAATGESVDVSLTTNDVPTEFTMWGDACYVPATNWDTAQCHTTPEVGDYVRFTKDNSNNQSGGITSNYRIDFTQPFTATYDFELKNSSGQPADGFNIGFSDDIKSKRGASGHYGGQGIRSNSVIQYNPYYTTSEYTYYQTDSSTGNSNVKVSSINAPNITGKQDIKFNVALDYTPASGSKQDVLKVNVTSTKTTLNKSFTITDFVNEANSITYRNVINGSTGSATDASALIGFSFDGTVYRDFDYTIIDTSENNIIEPTEQIFIDDTLTNNDPSAVNVNQTIDSPVRGWDFEIPSNSSTGVITESYPVEGDTQLDANWNTTTMPDYDYFVTTNVPSSIYVEEEVSPNEFIQTTSFTQEFIYTYANGGQEEHSYTDEMQLKQSIIDLEAQDSGTYYVGNALPTDEELEQVADVQVDDTFFTDSDITNDQLVSNRVAVDSSAVDMTKTGDYPVTYTYENVYGKTVAVDSMVHVLATPIETLTKSIDKTSDVNNGDTVTYTLTVGPLTAPASQVTFIDPLTDNLNLVDGSQVFTVTNGTTDVTTARSATMTDNGSGQTIDTNIDGNFEVGDVITLSFEATIQNTTANQTVTNTADAMVNGVETNSASISTITADVATEEVINDASIQEIIRETGLTNILIIILALIATICTYRYIVKMNR